MTDWIARQAAPDLFLSTISPKGEGQRRNSLLAGIEGVLREDFAGRILPFNRAAARAYAEIAAARRAAGHPISQLDCQIAAIARSLGASVATRDSGGFRGCGIDVIDPWASG